MKELSRNPYNLIRREIIDNLDVAREGDVSSKITDLFLMTLIVLNVFAVVLETVDSIYNEYSQYFVWFEYISVSVFTLEYMLRIWCCTVKRSYRHPFGGRLRYASSGESIIDVLSILPTWLQFTLLIDTRVLRLLKLFRMVRVLKIGRYSQALVNMGHVLKARKEELAITIFVVVLMILFSSSMMYAIEGNAQPDAFPSIPETMWWAVVTLTTVGYGDVYPVTVLGRVFGALMALSGIGLFALPAGILAAGLTEAMEKERRGDNDRSNDGHGVGGRTDRDDS